MVLKELINTGKPYTRKEIKFQFGSKPHDIDIPVAQIEAIDFDSLYSYSTEMELKAFLAKHTAPTDLPEDDFDLSVTEDTQTTTQPTIQTENTQTENIVEMGSSDESDSDDIDIDDIDISDVDTQEEEVDKKKRKI